nr:pilus assembly protein TadG-related protein [Halomonas sp. OfavH-34-E]
MAPSPRVEPWPNHITGKARTGWPVGDSAQAIGRANERRCGPASQRGAIGVMTAFLLVGLVVVVTLALDAGRLYLEQRRLQQAADLAAVSTAAGCDALFQGEACRSGELRQAAIAAAAANGVVVGADSEQGEATLGVTQGALDDEGVFDDEEGLANAVSVVLNRQVPSSLLANLGELLGNEVEDLVMLQASGVARRTAVVTLSAGTRLLALDTSESTLLDALLGKLIGGSLDLTVLGADDGVGLDVSLGEVLDVDALDVDLDEGLTQNLAQTLNEPLVLHTLGSRLASVLDLAGGNPVLGDAPGDSFTLGELLAIDTSGEVSMTSLLEARVPVRDLLEGALLLTTSKQQDSVSLGLADLSPLVVGLGLGLADISLELDVISPPSIAVGPPGPSAASLASDCAPSSCYRSVARNAQLGVALDVELNVLGLIGVKASTRVTGASGKAAIGSLAPADDSLALTLAARRELLEVTQSVEGTGLLGIGSVSQTVRSGGTGDATQLIRWPAQKGAEFDDQGGAQLTGVLSGLLSDLGLSALLSGTLTDVNTILLEPLLEGLGIGINTLEVRVLAVDAGGVESLTACEATQAGCRGGT